MGSRAEYAEILAGNYPRRSDDKDAPMSEEVKSAANSYKQNFTTSADPLYKLVSKIGSVAGTAGGLRQIGCVTGGGAVNHEHVAGGWARRPG